MKQIVFYSAIDFCIVGRPAHCIVVNHPKAGTNQIVNGDWVWTSDVIKILEDGPNLKPMFETLNSLYSPIDKWKAEEVSEADASALAR